MKTQITGLISLLILLFTLNSADARQRIVENTFDAVPGQQVAMNLTFGNQIVIKAWDRPQVYFRASVEVNGGSLNDALTIEFTHDGIIRVHVEFDKEMIRSGRAEDCAGNNHTFYNRNNYGDGNVICSEIFYEIYLPSDADLAVETINADIELAGLHGPVKAKSISGFVDMSWMGREGAELTMKTISGGVYSDLEDIQFYNKEKFPAVGQNIRGKTGPGGTRVILETISGDIFLRKGI